MPETNKTVKDVYMSNDSVKRLIELIMGEVNTRMPDIATEIPMTTEDANSEENKNKIPTVLAVFNALCTIDHIKFRLMKGAEDQEFEDYMLDKTPEELALYFYRPANANKFDLWIYDATSGYARVGYDGVSLEDLGLDGYWSKEELDMNAYWSKEELDIDSITGGIDLGAYAKITDLENYVRKDEIGTMTEEDVEEIFNTVKGEMA